MPLGPERAVVFVEEPVCRVTGFGLDPDFGAGASVFRESASLLTASFAALSASALACKRCTTWDNFAFSRAFSSLVFPTLIFCLTGFKEMGFVAFGVTGSTSGFAGSILIAGFFCSGSIFLIDGFVAEDSAWDGEISSTSVAVKRFTV